MARSPHVLLLGSDIVIDNGRHCLFIQPHTGKVVQCIGNWLLFCDFTVCFFCIFGEIRALRRAYGSGRRLHADSAYIIPTHCQKCSLLTLVPRPFATHNRLPHPWHGLVEGIVGPFSILAPISSGDVGPFAFLAALFPVVTTLQLAMSECKP